MSKNAPAAALVNIMEERARTERSKSAAKRSNTSKRSVGKSTSSKSAPVKKPPSDGPMINAADIKLNAEAARQAIILSEVIGPPLSKRRGR